jgi:hypothetical protein
MDTSLSVESADRADRLAPWLVGLFFAIPVLIGRYPPMADLPNHEASVGLLRHWGDQQFSPATLYVVNIGQANQLFSLLVLLMAYLMPIGWASKVVVAASLVALPVAAAHFATHLRAPRWSALLVAPLGFGWLFFWGLIQNIIGLVTLLALLPAIDRFALRPTIRRAFGIGGAMILLHFAHEAMQIVACIALVMCSIGAPSGAKRTGLRMLPIAFTILSVVAVNHYSWRSSGPRLVSTVPLTFYSYSWKLESLPGVLFGGYEPYVRNTMMGLALAPVLLFAVDRFRQTTADTPSWSRRVHRWRFELLALVLFIIYLVAPATIRSTTLVYHRFLPPAWSILAVSAAAGSGSSVAPLRRVLCAAVPVGSLLIAWPTFVDSDRIYTDLEAIVDHIEPGSAVMALNFGPNPPHRLWDPVAAMGHIVALRGGRCLFDYTQSPVSPVFQRPEKQWIEPQLRLEKPYELRPDWDFTRFRYLALVTGKPNLVTAIALALKSDARLTASQGDWYLFESILPVVAIDADDEPLPMPHPPTLRRKLEDLAHEFEERDGHSAGAASDVH